MESAKKKDNLPDVKVEKAGAGRMLVGFIKIRVLGLPDPIYERMILLKKLKKTLKHIDIKGINFSKNALAKDFGEYLFNIYRYFYPLKKVIDFSKPKIKRNFTEYLINTFANDNQKEILKQLLSEDFIRENLTSSSGKTASQKIKDMYKTLQNSFTKEQVKKINSIFSLGISLYEFFKFDLYVLIKKFTGEMKEENVTAIPPMRDVPVEQVETLIKDMTDHFYMLSNDANYYDFIEHFSRHLGRDIIPQEDFNKFIKLINKLVKSNYLMMMVQYITQDVFFRPFYSFAEKPALAEFMQELANDINGLQTQIAGALKIEKQEKILKDLFGSANFMELTSYTPEQNEYLTRNNITGFIYTDPLNILKKFMMDVYNRYFRKSLHTFILKATFVSHSFQEEMNSYYYICNNIIEQILSLEEKLKGKEGWDRISSLIKGRGKDSNLSSLAKKYVAEVNDSVKDILDQARNSFEPLKERLKEVIESYNKNQKDPITNIKNFSGTATADIMKQLAHAYNDLSKILVYFKIVIKD